MSYTNQTPHYHLPQYIGSDKPSYLSDFNDAMSIIDTNIYNANANAETALNQSSAASTEVTALTPKVNDNTSDIELLKANVTNINNAINANFNEGIINLQLYDTGNQHFSYTGTQAISYRQFIMNKLKITAFYGVLNLTVIPSSNTSINAISLTGLDLKNLLGESRLIYNVGNIRYTRSNESLATQVPLNLGFSSSEKLYYTSPLISYATSVILKDNTPINLQIQMCILG